MNITLTSTDIVDQENYVIAALRVQVGRGGTTRIPSQVFVEGRKIPLKRNNPDWYAIVLTAQEVAISLRKGFVTMKIDKCHSLGNNPEIDSVEVYALPRSTVSAWINSTVDGSRDFSVDENDHLEQIFFGVDTLRFLASIGDTKGKIDIDKKFLATLSSSTVIASSDRVNDAIASLLSVFEDSFKEKKSVCDESRLVGLIRFLQGTASELSCSFEQKEKLVRRMEIALRLACGIAKNRPEGYLKVAENHGGKMKSIALLASNLLHNDLIRDMVTDGVITQLTDLCLIEMAIAGGGTPLQANDIDHFSTLQSLLQLQNKRILVSSCRSVMDFCKRFQTPQSLGNEPDPFAAQTMVAVYGCDSCSLFPIEGTRYTLTKDHNSFDLCKSCYQEAFKYASSNRFRKGRDVLVNGNAIGDNAAKLSCADVRIMVGMPQPGGEVVQRQQVYEDFLGNLFFRVAGLISEEVKDGKLIESNIIELATELIGLSEESCRLERKKRLAIKVVEGLSQYLARSSNQARGNDTTLVCLCILTQLLVVDDEARLCMSSPTLSKVLATHMSVDNSELKCTVHNSPLELRQIQINAEEPRKFVACKSDRCGMFKWVTEDPEEAAQNISSIFDGAASTVIWDILTQTPEGRAFMDQIRKMIESKTDEDEGAPARQAGPFAPYTHESAMKDILDGVVSGTARIRNTSVTHFLQGLETLPRDGRRSPRQKSLVDTALELFSLCCPHRGQYLPSWHGTLCKMIGSEKVVARKLIAKAALFRLCGGDAETYHRIRDHFAFAKQLGKLVGYSTPFLQRAITVREKAHACGSNWRLDRNFSLSTTNGLSFVGVRELIPEGSLSARTGQTIKSVLDEILAVARKRSKNWQSFCNTPMEKLTTEGLKFSPLMAVFALALLLDGESQGNAMKLSELALCPSSKHARQQTLMLTTFSQVLPLDDLDFGNAFFAFCVHAVLYGQSTDVRRLGCSIAQQMVRHVGKDRIQATFPKLLITLEKHVTELGKSVVEFASILSFSSKELKGDPKLHEYSQKAENFYMQQVTALRHHKANRDVLICEFRSASTQRKRFDLAMCWHCCKSNQLILSDSSKRSDTNERRSISSSTRSGENPARRSSRSGSQSNPVEFVPGQVSQFSRTRLNLLRANQSSDEFCLYIELKNRLVSDTRPHLVSFCSKS